MGVLVPRTTDANASPYMRRSRICKQRLIGSNVLEAKQFFRRLKCREVPSWLCLLTRPAISQGFLWARLANDDTNDRKSAAHGGHVISAMLFWAGRIMGG